MSLLSSTTATTTTTIPLTILSGFLGSGKTTLVNSIINKYILLNKKVAIIQNEFSNGGVEDSIIKSGEEIFTNIIELSNGCICCSVKNDFVAGLEQLCKIGTFDYIICECSGIADPSALLTLFWQDDDMGSNVYLDGLITVVDIKNFNSYLNEEDTKDTIIRQLTYADRILLNKIDLATEDECKNVLNIITSYNPTALIYTTEHSNIDLSLLLSIHAFKNESLIYQPPLHPTSIRNFVVNDNRPVDLVKLNHTLGELLWEEPRQDIFRMKGIINTTPRTWLQSVKDIFEVREGTDWQDSDIRFTKIILIGKDLNEEYIRNKLNNIFINN